MGGGELVPGLSIATGDSGSDSGESPGRPHKDRPLPHPVYFYQPVPASRCRPQAPGLPCRQPQPRPQSCVEPHRSRIEAGLSRCSGGGTEEPRRVARVHCESISIFPAGCMAPPRAGDRATRSATALWVGMTGFLFFARLVALVLDHGDKDSLGSAIWSRCDGQLSFEARRQRGRGTKQAAWCWCLAERNGGNLTRRSHRGSSQRRGW